MKEGWEYKKLKEIGKTQTGSTPSKSNDAYYGKYIPFIRPAELNFNNKGDINYDSEIKLSELGANCSRVIDENSILMCCIGSVGKTGFTTQKVTCNQQINTITPYNDYNARFVYYALLSPEFQEEAIKIANSARATLAIISKGKWENITIPVPSLAEQQQIVSFLDSEFEKIDALKANAEEQLQAAKDLFQKALKEMLTPKDGWEIESIGNVFKSYSGGTPIKSHQEYYDNATIPWLNSGEVCQKYITSTNNYISELGLKNSSAKFFPVNTVLIAMYGATAAQAGILKFEATSNQAVCGLLPTKEMLPEFVYYWFLHNKTEFASMAQGGAQPNLSQVKIKAMPIPVIEIEQQQSICDKLNTFEQKVKQLQDNYTETITLCNDLKQALLKKVFEEGAK